MNTINKVLTGILCLIIFLAVFMVTFVTFTGDNLAIPGITKDIYAVPDNPFGDILPSGALAVLSKVEDYEIGHIVVYGDSEGIWFGLITRINGAEILCLSEEGKTATTSKPFIRGRVTYRVNNLGTAAMFIQKHRVVIWIAETALFLAACIYLVTLPKRKRRAEISELIKLFDYYGKKYDLEDADIDY